MDTRRGGDGEREKYVCISNLTLNEPEMEEREKISIRAAPGDVLLAIRLAGRGHSLIAQCFVCAERGYRRLYDLADGT
jgi:hypothetical protein